MSFSFPPCAQDLKEDSKIRPAQRTPDEQLEPDVLNSLTVHNFMATAPIPHEFVDLESVEAAITRVNQLSERLRLLTSEDELTVLHQHLELLTQQGARLREQAHATQVIDGCALPMPIVCMLGMRKALFLERVTHSCAPACRTQTPLRNLRVDYARSHRAGAK